jgi:tetratricopeptide (TPR) repeat protein
VSDITRGHTSLSRWQYLMTSSRVMVTYLRLLFFPVNQNLDYDYPTYQSLLDTEVLLSFLFLLFIVVLGVYGLFRSRHGEPHLRLISFGIFWFFINLMLESSIIPLNNVIYEHRLYLPSIGISMAFGVLVFAAGQRVRKRWNGADKAVVGALALVVVILTGATFMRNGVWRNEISLWQDVVKKSLKKGRGYNMLGNAYYIKGGIDKAIGQYKKAIGLQSGDPMAHNNLGQAYGAQGEFDRAINHFITAIRIKPDYPEPHYNLGRAYLQKGLYDLAVKQFELALHFNPYYAEAYSNLGVTYLYKRLYDIAIRHFNSALKINPDFPEAYNNLGFTFYQKGEIDKAIEHYSKAIELDPDFARAHMNLGNAYMKKDMTYLAEKHYRLGRQLKKTK